MFPARSTRLARTPFFRPLSAVLPPSPVWIGIYRTYGFRIPCFADAPVGYDPEDQETCAIKFATVHYYYIEDLQYTAQIRPPNEGDMRMRKHASSP
jgi:hypothetical protein